MKHRKPTQHIRRYKSGRWTCVNRGIRYYKAGDKITGELRCPYCNKNKKELMVVSKFNRHRCACAECQRRLSLKSFGSYGIEKQTQHARRYRSGRHTLVNNGIYYKKRSKKKEDIWFTDLFEKWAKKKKRQSFGSIRLEFGLDKMRLRDLLKTKKKWETKKEQFERAGDYSAACNASVAILELDSEINKREAI